MADIITMPKLGFDMAEGTLVRWVKREGDIIEKGDVIAEIETDKATVEVESNYSGVLRQILVEQGSILPVNQPMAIIGTEDEDISSISLIKDELKVPKTKRNQEGKEKTKKVEDHASGQVMDTSKSRFLISPLARKLAKEYGIPLENLKGSGPSGRIVKNDIDLFIKDQGISSVQNDKDQIVPLKKLRMIIGKRMTSSKKSIPHFYITRNFGVDKLFDLRTQFNDAMDGKAKISVNDLVVKATAVALRRFKNLNASINDNDQVIQHGSINIGIAVSVEEGLMTVVCKDTDTKSLIQISRETKEMAERARAGKVKPSDIEGSTFSISNLGMYDVDEFIAIINPPEAAILALGTAKEVPVIENGSIQIGMVMKATISVDHRISDGAEAARFMQHLGEILQSPIALFVDI